MFSVSPFILARDIIAPMPCLNELELTKTSAMMAVLKDRPRLWAREREIYGQASGMRTRIVPFKDVLPQSRLRAK